MHISNLVTIKDTIRVLKKEIEFVKKFEWEYFKSPCSLDVLTDYLNNIKYFFTRNFGDNIDSLENLLIKINDKVFFEMFHYVEKVYSTIKDIFNFYTECLYIPTTKISKLTDKLNFFNREHHGRFCRCNLLELHDIIDEAIEIITKDMDTYLNEISRIASYNGYQKDEINKLINDLKGFLVDSNHLNFSCIYKMFESYFTP